MGNVGSVGCVGFLVEGTNTGGCILVDEAGSCLSGGPHPLVCFGVSVNLL